MKTLILLLAVGGVLFSQAPPEPFQSVNQVDGAPGRGYQTRFDYDGGGNPIYMGVAQSLQPEKRWTVDNAGLTSITVVGGTATVVISAHGLSVDNRIYVRNSSNAVLNQSAGYKIASVVDANTITFTTAAPDGAHTNGQLMVITYAPRTNDTCWSIQKLVWSGANNTISMWAEGNPQSAKYAWDSRTTYAYQ